MAIQPTDIQFFLSGGASNTDPNASLGGAISSTAISSTALNNLFDNVSGAEASAGDTEYRCYYVKNAHASLTWQTVKTWISSQTTSPDTSVEIGLDPAGVNGTATTVADESTAPAGVTFSAASVGSELTIGNIPAGQYQAIWVKRIVNAGAAAYSNDTCTIEHQGDTAA